MERKALGKGLEALFRSNPLEDEAIARGPVTEVELAHIRPNPYQPRSSADSSRLQELVESVRVHGILQPLLVRRQGDGFELVAGERRFRAAVAAGLDRVPAVVRECTNREMLELALIENIQREDISAIDAAQAFRRLIDEFGLTQEELGLRLGRSRPAVANTLRLLNLPRSIQERVQAGELSEGHARALLSLEGLPEVQQALADRIVLDHLTVREAERLAREAIERPVRSDRASAPSKDPHLTRVEEQLQRHFGTRVTISRSGSRGHIRIDFYDKEQLDRILELLAPPL